MKEKTQNPTSVLNNSVQACKVEFHSRHHKLVVRDVKTGKYAKKPNKR